MNSGQTESSSAEKINGRRSGRSRNVKISRAMMAAQPLSSNINLYAAEPARVRGATNSISADREVRRVDFRYGGEGVSAPFLCPADPAFYPAEAVARRSKR